MEITAAVLRAADAPYALEKLTIPDPGPGQVLVKVAGTGICHTDLLPRAPGFLAAPPIVTGHEASGVVAAVGPGVSSAHAGDHVVLSFDSCGSCDNCLSALPSYCDTFFLRNMTGLDVGGQPGAIDSSGGAVATRWFGQSSFATYALATARNTVVVDAGLPLELLGPLGCGIQTGAGAVIRSLRVQAGDTIAVFGVGAVGLAAVMAAKAVGAGSIVAVDRHESRLALAEELGATHVVPAGDDVIDKVLAAAGGVHYSLDTTGVPGVIAQAVACLRPTGTCGLVAAQTGDLVLDPAALAVGRTVKGVLEGDSVPQSFIPFLINLWQRGRFPFERLIKTYPLDAINEAEHDALAGLTVKPVLVPHG